MNTLPIYTVLQPFLAFIFDLQTKKLDGEMIIALIPIVEYFLPTFSCVSHRDTKLKMGKKLNRVM